MTDKELIYNYLDRYFRIDLDKTGLRYIINDKLINFEYNLTSFSNLFLNVFSDYIIEDNLTSFEMMLNWYRERVASVAKMYEALNYLRYQHFKNLTNYKRTLGKEYFN